MACDVDRAWKDLVGAMKTEKSLAWPWSHQRTLVCNNKHHVPFESLRGQDMSIVSS